MIAPAIAMPMIEFVSPLPNSTLATIWTISAKRHGPGVEAPGP
jgi:hypothetical protein